MKVGDLVRIKPVFAKAWFNRLGTRSDVVCMVIRTFRVGVEQACMIRTVNTESRVHRLSEHDLELINES
jgi:hypothetical protein